MKKLMAVGLLTALVIAPVGDAFAGWLNLYGGAPSGTIDSGSTLFDYLLIITLISPFQQNVTVTAIPRSGVGGLTAKVFTLTPQGTLVLTPGNLGCLNTICTIEISTFIGNITFVSLLVILQGGAVVSALSPQIVGNFQ